MATAQAAMARDALLWVMKQPHRAVALLDALPDGHWAGSVLSDLIQDDRRRRGFAYFDPVPEVCMPGNVAVNLCIELLQGDLAVLALVAASGGRPHSLCKRMVSARANRHYTETGEELVQMHLFTDGTFRTKIVKTTRQTVDADRTEPGDIVRVRWSWTDPKLEDLPEHLALAAAGTSDPLHLRHR